MGQFRVIVTLHPRAEGQARRLETLVDTGAGYTVVPRPVLEELGCVPHRMQPVRFADGRVEEWSVAEVEVEWTLAGYNAGWETCSTSCGASSRGTQTSRMPCCSGRAGGARSRRPAT